MPAGRPRQPIPMRRLLNNPSRRPIPEDTPEPPTKAPRCPKNKGKEFQALWHYICGLMNSLGPVLCESDGLLIKLMATHLLYRDALERSVGPERAAKLLAPAREDGSANQAAYPYLDPRLYQIGKEDAFLLKCMSECGLTPAARARIRLQVPKKEDQFDSFRKKKTAA